MVKSIEALAESHAIWVGEYTKMVYREAFIHGFKHGQEEQRLFYETQVAEKQ